MSVDSTRVVLIVQFFNCFFVVSSFVAEQSTVLAEARMSSYSEIASSAAERLIPLTVQPKAQIPLESAGNSGATNRSRAARNESVQKTLNSGTARSSSRARCQRREYPCQEFRDPANRLRTGIQSGRAS